MSHVCGPARNGRRRDGAGARNGLQRAEHKLLPGTEVPPMAGPERLEGRNGQIWRAYLEGHTQEAIAERFGISQQRVSQIIEEVRESIPEVARVAAALLDLERMDLLLTGVMPPALAGDTKAAAAVLRILERRAKALGTDVSQPLEVVLDARLDVVGQLVADALAAAMDAVPGLSEEQRIAALSRAQEKLFEASGRDAEGGSGPGR